MHELVQLSPHPTEALGVSKQLCGAYLPAKIKAQKVASLSNQPGCALGSPV